MESGLIGSYDMLVMSNEVIGMVKHILRGIRVDDDHLAAHVIDRVGPGGHYLGDDHTLKHFKTEFWYPTLLDRTRWDDWQAAGSRSLGERVREKVLDIIENFEPEPLEAQVQANLKAIIERADKLYKEEEVSLM